MASNTSDQFFPPGTPANANFAANASGQTNSFFLPKVNYSLGGYING